MQKYIIKICKPLTIDYSIMKTSVVASLQTMCLKQALMRSSDHFSFPLDFSFRTAGKVFASNKNTYFLPSQLIISSNPTSFSPRFISTTSSEQSWNCSNQLNGCNRHKHTGMIDGGVSFLLSFSKAGLSVLKLTTD